MSDVVEVRYWENGFLEVAVFSIKYKEEFYFFAKDIAEALGYKDTKKAIQEHVTDSRDKIFLEELFGANFREFIKQNLKSSLGKIPSENFLLKIRRNHRLLTEFGFYCICSNSRMKKAKLFKRWIFETIKEIRKTGSYVLPGGAVNNPLDLLDRVKTLEKELKSQQKKSFISRGTQTPKNTSDIIENLFRKFEIKMEKSIVKTKSELKKSLEELTLPSSPHNSFSSSSPYYRSSSDSE